EAAPREQHVLALPHVLRLVATQRGEVRSLTAPRQRVVDRRARVERARGSGRGVQHVHAIAELFGGVDGVGEEFARVVELVLIDVADGLVDSRYKVAQNEVGAAARRLSRGSASRTSR